MSKTITTIKTILLTGGLGFIGSNICVELLKLDYNVIVIDNLMNSNISIINKIKTITNKDIRFYKIDIKNYEKLDQVFKANNIYAVIHLASLKSVGDSITKPLDYYENNFNGTISLLKAMNENNCKRIIFSSSASIYGFQESPIKEENITGLNLTNPYAKTKFMIEELLKDLYNSDNSWSIVILRYFNPLGAHESGLLGDSFKSPTNIFPRILNAAFYNKEFLIYGKDYETNDGTGIRDYIHIKDLSDVHVLVLNKLNHTNIYIYNVGTNKGTSVLELLNEFTRVNNINVKYEFAERRGGDVSCLYASCDKLFNEFNWRPKKTLEDMCKDGWNYRLKTKDN